MTKTVTYTYPEDCGPESHDYTATMETGASERVVISVDGEWAGEGELCNGKIVDCAAAIPEEVYEVLEQGLTTEAAERVADDFN